ncbi:MAG TPA: BTAD domain-containing putative transcriptional regulator [Acidimicrobiia bacterium]|nr:BTAD domain-containing putative transcriptional regulator [Acidimicrobiia bacterium]
MELRILGPTEVRHDGSPVTLRGAKPRQLLVLLAMRPNRPVPAEQLIEELWDGEPPPSAATALRVHVGRLRQVLELSRDPDAPSGRLPAGPHGYLLRIEPDELDVQRFERLIVLAREADAHGDPAAAVPRLTEALDMWRGAALGDARDLGATRSEVARLEELRVVAIEQLADCRLALGEHALVVDSLTAAIREHPLRERLTESVMLALYRSNRQADALRAYSDLAHRLDEELGLAPSARLRRLEEDVLLQRPALDFVAPRAMSPATGQRGWAGVRFIGRRHELHELGELLDAARAGERRSALVVGPPGIGKTTLVQEYCARIRRQGAAALLGYCDPNPAGDYQPVAEILRALVGPLDDATRASLPGVLRLVLPELAPNQPAAEIARDSNASGSNVPGAHLQLFDAIASTLERFAESPRVLVVEDLHWADRPTLALLRYLQRHPRLDHLLVVATLRDDEQMGERGELIEHFAPRANSSTLHLDGFGDLEVRALIRSAAPPETMPEIIDASSSLQDITGGNPYYLRELLRELDEEPTKLAGEGDLAQTLATIAPAGVRALVDRRLDRLTAVGREVLDAAAVLGRDVSVELLATMCGESNVVVFDALEESLAARLLVEDFGDVDGYLFPHMLTRNAVYAAIAPEQRTLLHQRAGEALEQSGAPTARRCVDLARHFGEAASRGLGAKAAEYAERAGDDSAARFAFAAAARWYEQAVGLRDADSERYEGMGRMHLALGRAYANDGQLELGREAFERAAEHARQVRDPALFADVALAADGQWISVAELRRGALPLLEEALGYIGDDDLLRRVQILNGIASDLYYSDPDREGVLARDAVALAQRTTDPGARALAQLALHRWYTHQPEARRERLEIASEAAKVATRDGGMHEVHLLVHRSLLADLIENAMVAEFDALLDDYERSSAELGSPRDIYWASVLRATQATWRGDLDAGEQLARGAAMRGRELEQTSVGAYILQRFVVRFQQARLAEELTELREVGGAGSVFRAGAALPAVAYAELGQPERAVTVAIETLGDDGSSLPRDVFWLAGVALFASVAATAGDQQLLRLVGEMLAPCADHVVVFGVGGAVLGSGHHWLGLVDAARGRRVPALEHLAEATAIAECIGAPYWVAEAKVAAARDRRTGGSSADEGEARHLLRDARLLAERGGYARVLAQADAISSSFR